MRPNPDFRQTSGDQSRAFARRAETLANGDAAAQAMAVLVCGTPAPKPTGFHLQA